MEQESKLTLDEAIKHCLEVAEKHERHAKILEKRLLGSGLDIVDYCLQCAADHRQLAEWLKELKEAKRLLKAAVKDMNNGGCNSNCYKCKHCGACDYSERFTWKHTDEALKLIGGSENG